jgi:hypothetical protein
VITPEGCGSERRLFTFKGQILFKLNLISIYPRKYFIALRKFSFSFPCLFNEPIETHKELHAELLAVHIVTTAL